MQTKSKYEREVESAQRLTIHLWTPWTLLLRGGYRTPREHFIGIHTVTTGEVVSRNISIVPTMIRKNEVFDQCKTPSGTQGTDTPQGYRTPQSGTLWELLPKKEGGCAKQIKTEGG